MAIVKGHNTRGVAKKMRLSRIKKKEGILRGMAKGKSLWNEITLRRRGHEEHENREKLVDNFS